MAHDPAARPPRHRSKRAGDLLELGAGVAIVLLVVFIGSFFRLRLDLTSEKRHTLREATHDLVAGLEDVAYVKVYLHGELPADLKQLERATRDLLDEMRAIAPDNIQYSFVDPSAGPDDAVRMKVYDDLQQQGLQYSSIRMRGQGSVTEKIVFPGALVTYRDKTVPVQLLKTRLRTADAEIVHRSINNLEYEFASAIRQATTINKPRVAFLTGHGELPPIAVADITNALSEQYHVSRVRIDDRIDALSDANPAGGYRLNRYEALIIAKPDSTFSHRDRYVIDQFIMNGGKVLWAVDVMNAHLDSLRQYQMSMATPLALNIDDLLFQYGVRANKDLVLDKSCAPIELYTQPYGNQPKLERFPWYFEPVLVPQSGHPIVGNIDPVHTRFASSLDTVGGPEIRKTVLLTSSPYSRVMRSPVRVSPGIVGMDLGLETNATPHRPMAVLLEGAFTSAFADRLPPEFSNDPAVAYREKGRPTAMVVIGDGDVIANRVAPDSSMFYMLGFDRYANSKIYGNRELVVNAMNYLLDDQSLISIRSRSITLRQLDPQRVAGERGRWQVFNIVAPIVLSILAGLGFHLHRRRKNSRTA
ncbi:MAG: gliding motility-associated ABC transporter substrate-binding protein GldG [Flavobacteriales bacterium]|jgi:ABC-2 type transport system permease protein|nr:gliding motility-associated ABC transporter substrate-binding protein GldG [Flavobacteriales bacterium]